MSWLSRLFGNQNVNNNELRSIKLELIEKKQQIEQLRSDLERERKSNQDLVQTAVQSKIESLYQDLATPLTQLNTQLYLVDNEQPLTARDISAVARRISRICQDHGLTFFGNIREKTTYNSEQHELLNSQTKVEGSLPVIIRFSGVAYQGKTIRKAGVEPA